MTSGAFAEAMVYRGPGIMTEKGKAWEAMLKKTLGSYSPIIPCTQMMGVFLAIYALPHVAAAATDVDVKQVQTGLGLATGVHQISKVGGGKGKMLEINFNAYAFEIDTGWHGQRYYHAVLHAKGQLQGTRQERHVQVLCLRDPLQGPWIRKLVDNFLGDRSMRAVQIVSIH